VNRGIDKIITVENLGKEYVLSHQKRESYTLLRDVMTNSVKNMGRKLIRPFLSHGPSSTDPTHEEFWALKDVSFEIARGERVGIIGRNGAGKSTLLKILSRITEPTEGRVRIRGRVASLLEVGTGFHPELTGRENIYLNGAILGMTRAEIKSKFDEIVSFAEVEKFLDTPVKHYSSGMYVRLAFAVAAHLEPEILVVDEVLAVGDAQFQKKCLGKMDDVSATEGRTVLFVSHNMAAIQKLCQKVILLNSGKIVGVGDPEVLVDKYLSDSANMAHTSLIERKDRQGTGDIRFTAVKIQNATNDVDSLISGKYAKFACYFENKSHRDLKNFSVVIGIDDHLGNRLALLSSEITDEVFSIVPKHANCVEVQIERLPLTQGRYGFTIFSTINGIPADWIQNAGFFTVESGDYYGTGKIPPAGQGNFFIDYKFNLVL
jgi:lipopolysaccharide transport system ATP-binding protein